MPLLWCTHYVPHLSKEGFPLSTARHHETTLAGFSKHYATYGDLTVPIDQALVPDTINAVKP